MGWNRTVITAPIAAVAFLTATPLAPACLWDSDTLKQEAANFPGLAEIITGRFERQPPRYYEMRLARVSASVTADPSRLTDYDDAAVACDRLGRADEAIDWMARKLKALNALDVAKPEVKDHWYRYRANLGTFHAHRWLRGGADKANTEDLRIAEEEVAKAIEINPDAHFGREKYQLAAIRWLRSGPDSTNGNYESFLRMTTEQKSEDPSYDALPADVVQGISGLIVLGDAWQSVDVFWALGAALNARGDSSMAMLARKRVNELLRTGRKSLDPGFGEDGPSMFLRLRVHGDWQGDVYEDAAEEIEDFFGRARADAEAWNMARWDFMEARFAEGKHPDTHADFWTGWHDSPPAELPDRARKTYSEKIMSAVYKIAVVGVAGIAVGVVVARVVRNRRRRRGQPGA